MKKNFYSDFEDKFRGSRELIQSRLEVYLPFVNPLKKIHKKNPQALDLGCGRGEWLELLHRNNFEVMGIDLDEGMLSAIQSKSLNTVCADAIAYLSGMDSESQDVVTAFHLIEHIPFESLYEMVSDAYRILRPGGILILETPNPANLLVGSCEFYMDPTHLHPLPPKLTQHLVKSVGFERVKTMYLQETITLNSKRNITLMDVLGGVSPDYSIVAQKKCTDKLADLFETPFSNSYGVTLEELAQQYDKQQEARDQHANERIDQVMNKLDVLSFGIQRVNQRLNELTGSLQDEMVNISLLRAEVMRSGGAGISGISNDEPVDSLVRDKSNDAQGVSKQYHIVRRYLLLASFCVQASIKKNVARVLRALKYRVKHVLGGFIRKPRIKRLILKVMQFSPGTERFLRKVSGRLGLHTHNTGHVAQYLSWDSQNQNLEDLSPRAKEIYSILQNKK